MRVFLGTTEIAGYYRGLKSGFDELGVPCSFIDLFGHYFNYGGDDAGWLVRLIRRLSARTGRPSRYLGLLARTLLLGWAAIRHDVFIFGFGNSILPGNRDLRVLRLLGKKVIFQFHGSDSRPPYIDGAVVPPGAPLTGADVAAIAAVRKESVRRIDRGADLVVDTPAQGHFHERPFVVWLRLGLPCRPNGAPAAIAPRAPDGVIRILHSPSAPAAKGSDKIRSAVGRLKARGFPLELVEITGQPNAVVLEELLRCDFVIDQLYADYGMPGFATEAAWFGRPVLIGGYAKTLWESLLPAGMIPPTHYCHPDELDAAIEKLASDPAYRESLARRARTFVETVWHPRAVAERYLQIARGPVPPDWMFDPGAIEYWQGACLPEERVRALIAEVVAASGREALQLSDKPAVEAILLRESAPGPASA